MSMSSVGDKIKLRRKELKMTQDELAQLTGYKSRSSINKIEKGGHDIPRSKVVTFAKALQTTPAYLMDLEEDPEIKNLTPTDEERREVCEVIGKLSKSNVGKVAAFIKGLLAQDGQDE